MKLKGGYTKIQQSLNSCPLYDRAAKRKLLQEGVGEKSTEAILVNYQSTRSEILIRMPSET